MVHESLFAISRELSESEIGLFSCFCLTQEPEHERQNTNGFIGRTTRRAMRAYLRLRHDSSPTLLISKDEERLTYNGLRLLLERRAKRTRLSNKPKLHGFRRAFALNMRLSGVDIFVLQRLM